MQAPIQLRDRLGSDFPAPPPHTHTSDELLDNQCWSGEPCQPQPTHRHLSLPQAGRKRLAEHLLGERKGRAFSRFGWAQGHCTAWCPRGGGCGGGGEQPGPGELYRVEQSSSVLCLLAHPQREPCAGCEDQMHEIVKQGLALGTV